MIKATIDLTNCKYLMELHERIKIALNFPEGYGRNWPAFWDLINRDCEYNYVVVIGSETVADELKGSIKRMKELLERNKQHWAYSACPFDYEFVD